MNKPKIKGTRAESAFVSWLRAFFPHAERRTLKGGSDQGDVTGCPGLVFEVKDCKTWSLPAWMRETEAERVNANADLGILIIKPPGVSHAHPGDWVAVVHLAAFGGLLNLTRLAVQTYIISPARISKTRETWKKLHVPGTVGFIGGPKDRRDDQVFCLLRAHDLIMILNMVGYGRENVLSSSLQELQPN